MATNVPQILIRAKKAREMNEEARKVGERIEKNTKTAIFNEKGNLAQKRVGSVVGFGRIPSFCDFVFFSYLYPNFTLLSKMQRLLQRYSCGFLLKCLLGSFFTPTYGRKN
jgi:hypothetical protein